MSLLTEVRRLAEDPGQQTQCSRSAGEHVQCAVDLGLLNPMPCAECGAKKTDAHHEDYTRPLAVRWLCRRCHKAVHCARQIDPQWIQRQNPKLRPTPAIMFYVSEEEKAAILQAAAKDERSVSAWVRGIIREALGGIPRARK